METGAAPSDFPAQFLAPTWRSHEMARFAVGMAMALARGCTADRVERTGPLSLRCRLRDGQGNARELLLDFDSEEFERLSRLCVRPVLDPTIEIRPPGPADIAEMRRLELAAPVRRNDGTEVVIDHAGRQFDHAHLLRDHRWLAAFRDGRMLAVQGVAVTGSRLGGRDYRLAYNHYSRSDPATRQGGLLIHLVATLYRDVYPEIDQFLSVVDVRNSAGLRLSFGKPWPTRLRRLFLPTAGLSSLPGTGAQPGLDAVRAAEILNAAHEGMELWVPRTPAFLEERLRRAPAVYADAWRVSANAALAVWPSGEQRTYRKDGGEVSRTLALVLDHGHRGEGGQRELLGLLADAARSCIGRGISHLAVFVAEGDERTAWMEELAEADDVYAVCAPELSNPTAPAGPVYLDHVLF